MSIAGNRAPQGEVSNELFEKYLTEVIPHSQLRESENVYIKGTDDDKLKEKISADYAMCLVRSRYATDIQRGIMLLEDLCVRHSDVDPDYYFFLSLGYARARNYPVALKFLKVFIEADPGNGRVLLWREFLQEKLKRNNRIAAAIVVGSALVVGGLVGIGLTLLKLRR